METMRWVAIGAALGTVALAVGACGGDEDDEGAPTGDDIVVPDEPVPGIADGCGSVRLTQYWSTERGWCEFSSASAVLPDFVQAGLTLAIAEPYDGSSYEGEPGEACGECWEIDSIAGTAIVMVHDLCPIEGNPLCAGGHFHFDLTPEAADAVQGGGLDEAQARRVPCPVTGNVHAEILDRNEWGYLRLAFVNHRFPIRTAEYRAVEGDQWVSVQRSGGAWHVLDDGETFADGSPGGVFRFTSALGETVEGTAALTREVSIGDLFDTGARFAEVEATGGTCEFIPPADVYDEGWGGIDQVRWSPNPWGEATVSETTEGCADGSPSCVLVSDLQQWNGFHLYYRQAYPTDTFSRLTLQLRAVSGGGELGVAPSHDGEECDATLVDVGAEWTTVEIDVGAVCAALGEINAVTVSNHAPAMALLVDEVRFE
jgi:expansin (peptidoglycan-binding protein)